MRRVALSVIFFWTCCHGQAANENWTEDDCQYQNFAKYSCFHCKENEQGSEIALSRDPGIMDNQFRIESILEQKIFFVPKSRVLICNNDVAIGRFSIDQYVLRNSEYTILSILANLTGRRAAVIKLEDIDLEDIGVKQRYGIDLERTGDVIESTLRYDEITQANFSTTDSILKLLGTPAKRFGTIIGIGLDLPDVVLAAALTEISFALHVKPDSIAFIQRPVCSDDGELVFYEYTYQNNLSLKRLKTKGRTLLCSGAGYSTTIGKSIAQKPFDGLINDEFYLVSLVKKSLSKLGITSFSVSPISPIEEGSGTIAVTGLRNSINRSAPILGDRDERLKLEFLSKEGTLTIDQTYEYSIGNGRWKDPEFAPFKDDNLAKNATEFLGKLIATCKLIIKAERK
jgi:hypothetical protein